MLKTSLRPWFSANIRLCDEQHGDINLRAALNGNSRRQLAGVHCVYGLFFSPRTAETSRSVCFGHISLVRALRGASVAHRVGATKVEWTPLLHSDDGFVHADMNTTS